MDCPICRVDLSELDLVSRHEHVEICVENGPSVLVANESGQLMVKPNVPLVKQRKICPICSKTYNSIHTHFKTCALKNDLTPNLMLEYWDGLNSATKSDKKFPRDLLDKYIAKCVKEGRVGEQVEFARALSLSLAESDPKARNKCDTNQVLSVISEASMDAIDSDMINNQAISSSATTLPNAITSLVQNSANPTTANRQQRKRYRIELVDEFVKESNIRLRIERELAEARIKNYEDALVRQDLLEQSETIGQFNQLSEVTKYSRLETTLFFKARLKTCTNMNPCSDGSCQQDHQFEYFINGFERFALPLELDATSDKVKEHPEAGPSHNSE